MSRIRNNYDKVKIEHYKPRDNENELNYNNLLAVCRGNSDSNDPMRQHCDTKKGNIELHINPQNLSHINQIYYAIDGTILVKDNPDFTYDLNCTLNLNDDYGYLKENRRAALKSLKDILYFKYKDKQARIAFIKKKLHFYQTMSKGEYPEYCGVLIDYLSRHLAKWS